MYQIGESNLIERNRFGSENRIESNRNFLARIGMLYKGEGHVLRCPIAGYANARLCRTDTDQTRNICNKRPHLMIRYDTRCCFNVVRKPTRVSSIYRTETNN